MLFHKNNRPRIHNPPRRKESINQTNKQIKFINQEEGEKNEKTLFLGLILKWVDAYKLFDEICGYVTGDCTKKEDDDDNGEGEGL